MTPLQEAVALRKALLLPLDELLAVVREFLKPSGPARDILTGFLSEDESWLAGSLSAWAWGPMARP